MRQVLAGLLTGLGALLLSAAAAAFERAPELRLLQALPVEGMAKGNLSGLTLCQGRWLAVSDREDDRLFELLPGEQAWQATPELFSVPAEHNSPLPLPLLAGAWLRGLRSGSMDFEAISCDAEGNRYLASESLLAVLKLPPAATGGAPRWLDLDPALYAEGEARGLWQQANALVEGVAVSSDGQQLWLAAERLSRGLLMLERQDDGWRCPIGGCVLLAERRYLPTEPFGPGVLDRELMPLDFSALVYWKGRLWTLERNAHQVCRRHPVSAQRERCWSFATSLLAEPHLYPNARFGLAEALHIDEDGIFLGIDNNGRARADGDSRPWLYRFALPEDWQQGYRP